MNALTTELVKTPLSENDCAFVLQLRQLFSNHWNLFDGLTGEPIEENQSVQYDSPLFSTMIQLVRDRGEAMFVAEEYPLIVLAIPAASPSTTVALGTFLIESNPPLSLLQHAAARLFWSGMDLESWAAGQQVWNPETLLSVAQLLVRDQHSRIQLKNKDNELVHISDHLATTYEEICLLHRLTQNLRLSESPEELARATLDWLQDVIPSLGMAIQWHERVKPSAGKSRYYTSKHLLTQGEWNLNEDEFNSLLQYTEEELRCSQPYVVNRSITLRPDWPVPQVRQLIIVSLSEGENFFGRLIAINHRDDGDFGSVEANLLASVAAILGIHSGNIDLYQQQSELLAGIVRALTSAIDAKDPYTRGHSDRVARIAVRLAQEMGCDYSMRENLYLSGLLHDIGKIGVDDQILRKPGKLTPEEYAHIQRHVVVGHRILQDLNKLEDVLPVVLYHHEAWNGEGYPERRAQDKIPLAARIVAVADSYDAMSSDRPYRRGLEEGKIEEILREGAGVQWDPEVIAAFFRVREEILQISFEAKAAPSPTEEAIL